VILLPPHSVKICGLREPDHARAAVAAGADLLGFIFAPARRQVTAEIARMCIEAARAEAGGRPVLTVGVFVDASIGAMNATASEAGLDLLQLHGDEPPSQLSRLDRPAIKALRSPAGTTVAAVEAEIARYRTAIVHPVAWLIDGFREGASGGEGIRADWALGAALTKVGPMLLAGGLDASNVAEAIAAVHPIGVDVSSGVETDGRKDAAKIAAFVSAAKRALVSAEVA